MLNFGSVMGLKLVLDVPGVQGHVVELVGDLVGPVEGVVDLKSDPDGAEIDPVGKILVTKLVFEPVLSPSAAFPR